MVNTYAQCRYRRPCVTLMLSKSRGDVGKRVTDVGVAVVPGAKHDGMSYLLIPLIQRPSPELAPLRETLRAWVTVVATSADPCIVLNRDGRIAGVSASAAALFAEAPVELVGRRLVGDVFTLVDFSSAAEPMPDETLVPPTQAIATGMLNRGLLRLRRSDGRTLTLDAIATALHADDGTVIGSLTFCGQLAAH